MRFSTRSRMRALSNAKASQERGFFSSPGWPVNADGGRSLPSGPACAGPRSLTRGVEPVIQPLHVAAVHVRVDLRRRHVRVTEHLLHRAEVRSALEQVGRERVAQLVRRDPAADPRRAGVSPEQLREALARHPPAARRDEQVLRAAAAKQPLPGDREVGLHRLRRRWRATGDPPCPPCRGPSHAGLEVHVVQAERDELADPQPRRVEDSSIARSRRPAALRGSGAARSRAISSCESSSGRRRPGRGESSSSAGSVAVSFSAKSRPCSERIAESARAC